MVDLLQKAPLIEAIFEFRWQPVVGDRNGEFPARAHSYDLSAFPYALSGSLRKEGYSHIEHIVPEFVPPTPHQVRTRYRRELNPWPCVQTGDGILTVNQINDGYSWNTFRKAILSVFAVALESRDPDVPFQNPHFALRYIDGIPTESFSDLLADEMQMEVRVGKEIEAAVPGPVAIACRSASFAGRMENPEGASVEIAVKPHPNINGQPGAHLTYLVSGEVLVTQGGLTADIIEQWIEPAHEALSSLFRNTFTDEAFRRFR